jgi:type IV pilus assembly protein PilM
MPRSDAVWGIDIGQCALKALRCRPHEDPHRVVATAFDYIEFPKMLSQPDVDPAELIQDALKQFLSRNNVRGDRVVISVSGQSGLARFVKLPPVDAKKIPDIVRYEARQQIPFALTDVVWDYQQMVGGTVVEGFVIETEVGLFAMKRDQVYRALKPFMAAGIEVDVVQLAPLALYNYVVFDQMPKLPPPDEYDAESPPESLVLLSLGTDSTDLVVTNGYRMWQRSIPLGGSHFTKALTKELKLTFATAEHLKRNAAQAEDPRALFQAMRPVFNELLAEVQRSIGYYANLHRKEKISRCLALGNAMKLPGHGSGADRRLPLLEGHSGDGGSRVQGERDELRRGLWAVFAGVARDADSHQSAAARDSARSADPCQEALGGGCGGGHHVGVDPELLLPLAGMERGGGGELLEAGGGGGRPRGLHG